MKRLLILLLAALVAMPATFTGDGSPTAAAAQRKATRKRTTTRPAARKTAARKKPVARRGAVRAGQPTQTYNLNTGGQKAMLTVKPTVKRVVRRRNGRRIVTYHRIDQQPVCERFNGIDVSHYQNSIRWKHLKENNDISFVYVKATEGELLRDEFYEVNMARARETGLKVGSYHFFRANVPAEKQFENFRAIVKTGNQDLIPMIDVENTNAVPYKEMKQNLQKLIDLFTEYYGQKPLLYSMTSFYNSYLAGSFTDYPLMIGGYSRKPVLVDEKDYVIWQFTAHGKVEGINGNCDLDVFNTGHGIEEILFNMDAAREKEQERNRYNPFSPENLQRQTRPASQDATAPRTAPKPGEIPHLAPPARPAEPRLPETFNEQKIEDLIKDKK